MNFYTELIRHSDVSQQKLEEIIAVKSLRWPYSFAQHKDWMQENIKPGDFHILVYNEEKLIGYTNFVEVKAKVNGVEIPFMGIGNVCTAESGKGYGNILMNELNKAVTEKKWNGLLFCKNQLVAYYEKSGWKVVPKEKITSDSLKQFNTMTYNFSENIKEFEYNDRNF